ncbi:minor capsid protein [Paenibacillus alginolyticus]|uniref:minor capsid protein n=1 Tax=Paenibacillus alginolyticus TaxID=59839 RepID=UPI0003F6200F|nr:minor capsid protein [Paenibacillus alginolyticus]MCY9670304.1 minor capsid protein [Paenibacillus alginolyticus]
MINMANQLALYLQSEGAGTLGNDLFVDDVPQTPDEAIWLTHVGGNAEFKLDAPSCWRKLSLHVRSATSAGAQDRIWSAINKLLDPDNGVIEVDRHNYTVQITTLPAVMGKDAEGRYIIKSVLILRQVKPVLETWLKAITVFTEAALGSQWHVYRGFNGTCRPSVSWQCLSVQSASESRGACQLTKEFVGQIAARSANEYQLAAQILLLGLAEQAKLPMGGAGSRWLTVINSSTTIRSGDLSTGILTVTITGAASAPQGTLPLIPGVQTAASPKQSQQKGAKTNEPNRF